MCAIAAVSRTLIHVRFWHLADIRGTATFCPLPDQSGQRSILAGDGLSANDPTATFQHRKELSRSIRIIIGQNPYRRRSHGPLKWAVSTIGRSGLGHTKLEPSANS